MKLLSLNVLPNGDLPVPVIVPTTLPMIGASTTTTVCTFYLNSCYCMYGYGISNLLPFLVRFMALFSIRCFIKKVSIRLVLFMVCCCVWEMVVHVHMYLWSCKGQYVCTCTCRFGWILFLVKMFVCMGGQQMTDFDYACIYKHVLTCSQRLCPPKNGLHSSSYLCFSTFHVNVDVFF